MHPGRVVAITGTVPHNPHRFIVNLQCGGAPASVSDLALHVSVRFDDRCVVRNSQQGSGWQSEERGALPHSLRPGAHFQMLLLCEGHGFKIAFNGQHFCEFRHRMPYQRVTHVSVEGSVTIHNVTGILGAGGAQQTHNPPVPFSQNIGSLYPGRCIRVRGFVPHSAYRFAVNLATGPSADYNDVGLHVSTRPSEGLVELNSARRGGWESGQQIRPCPVRAGQHFEIMILVEEYSYKVAFNGVHLTDWPHRHPYQHQNHILVDGTVQLQLVSVEGQPRGGGYAPPPPPPYFPSPYDGHHHYPSPYPIIY